MGRRHLLARGQVQPQLEAGDALGRTCGISSWRMPLPDVIHWMSPAPMLSPVAERIAVPHLALPRTIVTVSIPRCGWYGKAGPVVGRLGRLEVIEQQERVEVIEPPGADAAPEVHPGALDDRLWRSHDLSHSS